MAIGDFLNTILPAGEHRGSIAPYAQETLVEHCSDVSWAVAFVQQVIPKAAVVAQPETAAPVTPIHTEIARSAIAPVENEAVQAPAIAPDAAEEARVERLMADVFAIHDEHSLEVARQLEAERQRQGDDNELAA